MRKISLVGSIALISLATAVFAQTGAHQHDTKAQSQLASTSDARKSFTWIKTLGGEWEGSVKTDMPIAAGMEGASIHVTMRVTSRGNVVVHEFQEANTPLDPSKYDHPVTMLYLDADQLNLVHYCDAGNRPHMTGKTSADGKTIEFDFKDLGGSNENGHMHHVVFNAIDENHHIEDWTYMLPNGQAVHAHFDLHRLI
jgi:hypothetical protein